jgi:hypothetical protein
MPELPGLSWLAGVARRNPEPQADLSSVDSQTKRCQNCQKSKPLPTGSTSASGDRIDCLGWKQAGAAQVFSGGNLQHTGARRWSECGAWANILFRSGSRSAAGFAPSDRSPGNDWPYAGTTLETEVPKHTHQACWRREENCVSLIRGVRSPEVRQTSFSGPGAER